MKYYKAYGLNIKTELELSQLVEISHCEDYEIDVTICYSKMPSCIHQKIANGVLREYSKEEFWFHLNKLGTFYIKNGCTINIEMIEGAEELRIHQFIYGRCFAFILLQRNIVALHSSSISINGRAIMLLGESGAGKSTLSSSLLLDGHGFLCDDVSRIEVSEMNISVTPAFPVQRLHEKTMIEHNYKLNLYNKLDYGGGKVIYFIYHHDVFNLEPLPLEAIFELVINEEKSEVIVEELRGKMKLKTICQHIFGNNTDMNPIYLKKCIKIAQGIPVYRISRPLEGDTSMKQKELIYNLLDNNYSEFCI